jgi:hypothetical protein
MEKNKPLDRMDNMQTAFDKMRLLMAADALSAFLDHNMDFEIYMDSSDYKIGACIMQDSQPIAYNNKMPNSMQKNFITLQKKALSLVATFKKCSIRCLVPTYMCSLIIKT